jgi:tRNA threonylcarbamoyladenosine biosynthesis protein TsaB
MALILNIETSSERCSVALSRDGVVIGASQSFESKTHASVLTILIEKLLAETSISLKQLDAVSISKGPGSYTGLRIGVSVAKGICYGADKPLVAINTLQSMLNGLIGETIDFVSTFPDETIFCPMLDARRQEVYLAHFSKSGNLLKETSAEIIHEESFLNILNERTMVFFGSGAEKVQDIIQHSKARFINGFSLKAEYLISLAEMAILEKRFEDIAYFEPFYLKDFVATIPKRKVI